MTDTEPTSPPPPSEPPTEPEDHDPAADPGDEPSAAEAEPRQQPVPEVGGRDGPDPTRYGDWEKQGRCIDF